MKRSSYATATAIALATALVAPAGAAAAVTAQETVNAGSLSFINSTPAAITFPGVTLNGTSAQSVSKPQAFDVDDATGSGAGWNITATSTQFATSGNATLPTGSVTIASAPSLACDSGVSCTTASNAITYPYTLPAGTTAPTATKLYNAAAGTGMAAQTVTPTWTLVVPAAASAGTYTSTWTLSLVSAP